MSAPIEMSEIEVRLDDDLYGAIDSLAQQCSLTPDQMASALIVLAFHRHLAQVGEPVKRRRVFCWLPTKVFTSRYFQDGCRWLRFVWLDADGQHYVNPEGDA